jgi:transglutaminase-like putative cysteine protease
LTCACEGTSRLAIGGVDTPIALYACDSPEDAAAFLQNLTASDPGGPLVTAAAAKLAAIEVDDRGPLVQQFVRGFVLYENEPRETFQTAEVTLRRRSGDCDDHARLVVVLARALGIPARLVILRKDGIPVHAVAQLADRSGVWHWAETTIAARWGEAPLDAKRRLGATSRADL